MSNNATTTTTTTTTTTFEINSSVKPYFTCIVFIISLVFICSSKNFITKHVPVGRAGASIIGATFMVYFGIVPPKDIGSVINWDTIILLMSMMMLSNYMEKANIWTLASKLLLYKCNSPLIFMVRVCLISAIMSSILTNDTVCVTLTPIVINACKLTNLPFFPYLMAIATSANIGSAALPVGNPQNMIIATAGGLNFFNFFKVSIVSSLLGVIINTALLYFYFKKDLSKHSLNFNQLLEISINKEDDEAINKEMSINNGDAILITTPIGTDDNMEEILVLDKEDKSSLVNDGAENTNSYSGNKIVYNMKRMLKKLFELRVSIILLLVLVGFFIGFHMGFTVLFGVSILMIMERKDINEIIKSVDWELLLFFSGLFVLVEGFDRQFAKEAWTVLEPFVPIDSKSLNILKIFIFSILILILCNILGNVPLVLSLCPRLLEAFAPDFTWLLLAFVSTVAGNLTLVGSVANLIVAEKAKAYHSIGFLEYLKFGVPSTIIVILVGVPIVVLIGK